MKTTTPLTVPGLPRFAEALASECHTQLVENGTQQHPDGTGRDRYAQKANIAGDMCRMDAVVTTDGPRWSLVLLRSVYEALAQSEPKRLRSSLVRVAAVCALWASDLDLRKEGLVQPELQSSEQKEPCMADLLARAVREVQDAKPGDFGLAAPSELS